ALFHRAFNRLVGRLRGFPAGHESYADNDQGDSTDSSYRESFAREERKGRGQRRIAGRERSDDRHFADFEGAVQRERRATVEYSGEHAPRPRMPARAIEQVSPAADPSDAKSEQEQSGELHVHRGAQRANAACRESRGKIRTAPPYCGEQTKK